VSTWLTDAVAEFVTSLDERALDRPLMSLLHHEGYHDIHLIHGIFESGKDIIAKRVEDGELIQFAIQSKAGDMGAAGWRDNRQQIELIWDSSIGHPAFDPDLRRRAVLAFNGKFKGTAAVEAQLYNEAREKHDEERCVFWTAEDLIPRFVGMLQSSQGYGLSSTRLLEAVTRLHRAELSADDVERFARVTAEESSQTDTLPAAVLSCLLLGGLAADAGMLHCGLAAVYGLVRIAWASGSNGEPVAWIREIATDFFADLGQSAEESLKGDIEPKALYEPMQSLSAFATYPVKCSITIEIMGMYSLAPWRAPAEKKASAELLAEFIAGNPGASKPLSDRWAFSLIAPVIALHRIGQDAAAKQLLMNAADWLFDATELGLGVAPRHSAPSEEIWRIFGRSFDFTQLDRRQSSYIATVIIDLAYALGHGQLYEDLINDLAAVRGVAELYSAPPGRGEYDQWSDEHYLFAALHFDLDYQAGDAPSQHYVKELNKSTPGSAGFPWDAMAIYGLFRERHTPGVILQLLEGGSNSNAAGQE
jgi:hypothetical protein